MAKQILMKFEAENDVKIFNENTENLVSELLLQVPFESQNHMNQYINCYFSIQMSKDQVSKLSD